MNYYTAEQVKGWSRREIEKALRSGSKFSKNAAKILISLSVDTSNSENPMDNDDEEKLTDQEKLNEIASDLKSMTKLLANR
jgi:hypothetical protein